MHLPIDSASAIVQLYRSTIASRYNLTLETLLSSDDDDEESPRLATHHHQQQRKTRTTGNGDSDVPHSH